MRRVIFERSAQKSLLKLPANIRALLLTKIEQLAVSPRELRNNVKRLAGTNESRLRVGDWRVIFRLNGNTVIVVKIAPRGSAYE